MNVIVLQVFVGLVLVCGALVLFAYSVRGKDHEHAERLSLLPIEDDEGSPHAPPRDG
jgi:hypothetical protein